MTPQEIAGTRWGYREKPSNEDEPLRPLEILQEGPSPVRKVRVRWLDGEYEGLDQWISKRRLVVPWDERDAFLSDEAHLNRLDAQTTVVNGSVEWWSVLLVLLSDAARDLHEIHGGDCTCEIENFESREDWLGISRHDLLSEPFAFIDRFGTYHAPFSVAEKLARRLCELGPRDVVRRLGDEEAELRQRAISGHRFTMGRKKEEWVVPAEHYAKELRERERAFARVREWCGETAPAEWDEVQALRKEIDRLRVVIADTSRWFRYERRFQKANQLLRELGEDPPDVKESAPPESEGKPREKLTYSPPEVAAFLGVNVNRVRRAIEKGQLYGVRFSHNWLVPKPALEAFLEGRVYTLPVQEEDEHA